MVSDHLCGHVDGSHADDASVVFTGGGDGEVMHADGEQMGGSSGPVHAQGQDESSDRGAFQQSAADW